MVERAIGSRKNRAGIAAILLCLATAAVAAGSAGCSNDADGRITNTITFKLDFGGGVMLTSVNYRLMGPNQFRRTGSLPVGNDPIVTATFQNLPPGQRYKIEVQGTASDDATGCKGELTFDVTASMTVMLQIPLTCQGLVAITGSFNSCPVIDSLSAIPSEVQVGASIDVTAEVHDDDNGPSPLSLLWATTGGALSNLSTAGATFTCTEPGTFNVGFKISDGDTTKNCPDSAKLTVFCTPVGS